jgi:hypothetical protein
MLELGADSLQRLLHLDCHTGALGPAELQLAFADSLLADSPPRVVAEKIHYSQLHRLAVVHLMLNFRQLQTRRPDLHMPASFFRPDPAQLGELPQEQLQGENRMHNVLVVERSRPGEDSPEEAVDPT